MAELLNNDFQELTPEMLKTQDGVNILNNIIKQLVDNVPSDLENVRIFKGYGTPESSVTAGIGSLYMRIDGGAGTSTYQKQSGTGNTGWVAVPGGSGSYTLTVEEQDGTPSIADVSKIKFPNGKVTDDGSGVVSVSFGDGTVSGTGTDNHIMRWDGTTDAQDSLATISDLGRIDVTITDAVGADTIGLNVNADKSAAGGANYVYGINTIARHLDNTVQSTVVGINTTTAAVDASGGVTNAYGLWAKNAAAGGTITNNYAAGFSGKVLLAPSDNSPGNVPSGSTHLETASGITKIVGDFHINGNIGAGGASLIIGSSGSFSNGIAVDTNNGSYTPLSFSLTSGGEGITNISGTNRITLSNFATGSLASSAVIPAGGGFLTGFLEENPSGRMLEGNFAKTTDTTLAQIGSGTVADLVVNLVAGKWYTFQVKLFVNADATGGHKYAIGGTATATTIIFNINSLDNTTGTYKLTSRETAMAGEAGEASGTSYYTEINGSILVNAAGTFNVQFAQNASNGTSTVLAGSSLFVKQIY